MNNTVRFSVVDESNIGDHAYLDGDDKCLYLFEYTSGRDYSFSSTNNLISNLKKKPSKKKTNPHEYRHKVNAMRNCSAWLGGAINYKWLKFATLVPIPPSKSKSDPEYDDRMFQICRCIPADFPVDIRELVIQTESTRAAHESPDCRLSMEEIYEIYEIDEALANPAPTYIAIVDDVITAGSHYKAMKKILGERFPGVPIVGLFVARRIFPNDEVADFEGF